MKARDRAWDARWKSTDDNSGQPQNVDVTITRESRIKCREAILQNPQTGAQACRWARKWRSALAAVLPSAASGGAPQTDKEVRRLCGALWKDIARWANGKAVAERGLGLFRADNQTSVSRGLEPGSDPADWAFVPLADLILVVGEGLIGCTVEGLFAESPVGHKRRLFASCYKKPGENPKARRRDRENRDRENRDRENHGDPSSIERPARASKWDTR